MALFSFAILSLLFLFVFYWISSYLKYQKNLKALQHLPHVRTQFFHYFEPIVRLHLIPSSWIPLRMGFVTNEKFSMFKKYRSPIFGFVTRNLKQIYVADADIVKQVIITHRPNFPKVHLRILEMFGRNLVSMPDGEIWKRHRKVAAPTFSDHVYRLVAEATTRIAFQMFEFWEHKNPQSKEVAIAEVRSEMLQVTLSVLSHSAFGKPSQWHDIQEKNSFGRKTNSSSSSSSSSSTTYTFQQSLEMIIDNFVTFFIVPKFLHRFFKSKTTFFDHMKQMVKERIQTLKEGEMASKHDLLTNLTSALKQEENEKTNNYLTEEELYGNLFLFIFAGHETAATTLTFALLLLATHPEKQNKFYEEIMKLIGNNRLPTYDDYPNLHYAQHIIKETLRLYPPQETITKSTKNEITLNIPFTKYQTLFNEKNENGLAGEEVKSTRQKSLEEEVKTSDTLVIPKGANILLNVPALHRNPLYWTNPDEFIPERFDAVNTPFKKIVKESGDIKEKEEEEEESSENNLPYNRYAFMPFSEGSRSCLGRKFAEVEIAFLLTLVIQRYSIRIDPKFTREQALESTIVLLLRPTHKVGLIFTKRDEIPSKTD